MCDIPAPGIVDTRVLTSPPFIHFKINLTTSEVSPSPPPPPLEFKICDILHDLHNLKNVKNIHGRVILLVKFQASAIFVPHVLTET